MKLKIDINCDLGESYRAFKVGNDKKVMRYITCANVACGFHAGDSMTITRTVNLAEKYRVAVDARLDYPALLSLWRREMQFTSEKAKIA